MSAHTARPARLLLASMLIVSLAAGCSINPATGKRELIFISEAEEIQIGQEAAPQFEKEFGGQVPSQTLQQYVRTVGGKVAAASDRQVPYEYTLVRSNVPNAFALPGGKVFLTAGLMRLMTNERQLAAVLGHETGHVAAKHNVKGMQRHMGAEVLVELAGAVAGQDKAESVKAAAKVAGAMALLRYSRKDEYQADMLGIRYMTRAGHNPWGMVELLELLLSLHDAEPGLLGEMFQTHPLTRKRIAEARQMIQSQPAYAGHSAAAADPNEQRFKKMRALLPSTK